MEVNFEKVPQALIQRHQWVLWRTEERDGEPTKVPYTRTGVPAKSNDPATWSNFDEIKARYERGGYDGVGYVFAADDPFCGIDLDSCHDPFPGKVTDWAREVILKLKSYAEVSPSEAGVKLFVKAKWNYEGHKQIVDSAGVSKKKPAIEIYDKLRYFAVTGMRLQGPSEPQDRQAEVDWLRTKFWPAQQAAPSEFYSPNSVAARAAKYIERMPPAISGQGGHNAAFRVACVLVLGFDLNQESALGVMRQWNASCKPPWSDRDLIHKLRDADKQEGERGYIRGVQPARFDSVRVPFYKPSPVAYQPRELTLDSAALEYLKMRQEGHAKLIETGIPDLDYALGGGIEHSEMMIVASRPSHGKSMIGLQLTHFWTAAGMPVLFLSEEMSPLALAKRTIQFASDLPEERWDQNQAELEAGVREHLANRAPCYIVETCRTADVAADAVRRHVEENKVQCVIVDYAQLIAGKGRTRYEQTCDMSTGLRRLANEFKIVVVALCQLNREIEKRKVFTPQPSDLRDAGQLEQDADVIVFSVWPHRISSKKPAHEYLLFVAKNRNRQINQSMFEVRIEPGRQRLTVKRPQDQENCEPFDAFAEEWK